MPVCMYKVIYSMKDWNSNMCGGKEGVEFGISMEVKFWFMTAVIML